MVPATKGCSALSLLGVLLFSSAAWSADNTLYAVSFVVADSQERLNSINPATAALTPIGSQISDCCLFGLGASTLDPNGDVVYWVGRRQSDGGSVQKLFGMSLASGAIVAEHVLSASLIYREIEFDPSTDTLYAIVFDSATTTQSLATIDTGTGAVTPIGAGQAGCCLVNSGTSALDSAAGNFHFVGRF